MKKTTIVDIRVETEWLEKVRAAADRKGMGFSQFIRMAVDYYLNRYKREMQNRQTVWSKWLCNRLSSLLRGLTNSSGSFIASMVKTRDIAV